LFIIWVDQLYLQKNMLISCKNCKQKISVGQDGILSYNKKSRQKHLAANGIDDFPKRTARTWLLLMLLGLQLPLLKLTTQRPEAPARCPSLPADK
jgi:hypothetical protein